MRLSRGLYLLIAMIMVLHAGQYEEISKLVASDKGRLDYFGSSVAVDGNYAIVGANLDDKGLSDTSIVGDAGSAYIFKWNGSAWEQQIKLLAPDRDAYDEFGWSVSIDGDYALVGAPMSDYYDSSGNKLSSFTGAGYVYIRKGETWEFQAKLVADDRDGDDRLGYSVCINGDRAILGARWKYDESDSNNVVRYAGAAYVYKRDGENWTQEAKFMAPKTGRDDRFGCSVSISGEFAAVGADGEDHDLAESNFVDDAGSAYLYKKNGGNWDYFTKIIANDRFMDSGFGHSIAISDDYLLIGAYFDSYDQNHQNYKMMSGSAYMYDFDGTNWNWNKKIVASDRTGGDYFGIKVALSGEHAIIGATGGDKDQNGENALYQAGAAYLYEFVDTVWVEKTKLSASDRQKEDYFGTSVGISNQFAFVGAYCDGDINDFDTKNSGAAYVYALYATESAGIDSIVIVDIDTSSLHISAKITQLGIPASQEHGFAWINTDMPDSLYVKSLGAPDSLGEFSAVIEGLETNTSYLIYAFIVNAGDTIKTDSVAFRTLGLPAVSILSLMEVDTASVAILYRLDDFGNPALEHFGLCYSQNILPTVEDTLFDLGRADSLGEYSTKTWYGFEESTRYYVRAYATNSLGTVYSDTLSFRTLETSIHEYIPQKFEVSQNYPNPFNPITQIKYQLPKATKVNMDIYNLNGNKVRSLVNTRQQAGYYIINFNANGLASGVYLYTISTENNHVTNKMVLMK